ncbi:AAA family ATPase [Salmonella enterica]|uniref:AAA domain-containing protein n=1 Tax=Citrobacter portucalensis TaxID=1639133 RepID=UPI0012733AC4|nr:nuclease [Salmonella enterica]ECC9260826.1 nuclease [Salmonella enterica subsp. diarizonae]MBS9134871.1 AAA family ATPase [Escherichia coli]EAQ6244601.1 nuclease [Salmonella enterica]EAU6880114.1 nuclease [Salmonella enterica]
MEIKIWEGGLQAQELNAIEKIKSTFSPPPPKLPNHGKSMQEQLRNISGSSMFPWKGYAGFRFVDVNSGYEGEFDLVIVTHCNVLIIELKDWNNGKVTSSKDNWYKNSRLMGRSPVSITRNKKFLLDNKIKRERHRFTNKDFPPSVEFLIVMTGNADFSQLPDHERLHTLSLDDFLSLSDKKTFQKKFRPHPAAQVLNKDFHVFDDLFNINATAPKPISVGGYKSSTLIFDEHPTKLYREFLAISEVSRQDEALLRVWDFSKFRGVKGGTPEGRYSIVSREREVLGYIKHQNHDLYKHCLRSLTSIQKEDITTEFNEIFELPPSHNRFNEFIGKFGLNFSDSDRINLVKLLIAKFADLHRIKIAHRDLADHSLWISPGKEIALSNFISAYHQPIGTVGDYRSQLSVIGTKPDNELTPFQEDVKSIGIICWHILSNLRMSEISLEEMQNKLSASTFWYSEILINAINGKYYCDAGELFDALKSIEPKLDNHFDFDDSELEPFRRTINHSRQYRDDEFIVETDEKEVYISGDLIVKAWLNINPTNDEPLLGSKIVHFLKRIERIASINPPYIPCIREYGIATKSSSLFLVTDKCTGDFFDTVQVTQDEKINIINKLIAAIEHLHGLGIYHGDLHPKNILVNGEGSEIEIIIIDIPDFCLDGNEPKSPRYCPEQFDSCTGFERDNFAVMRLSCELLGIEWGGNSEHFTELADCIKNELQDRDAGFKDLLRFKQALLPTKDITNSVIEITAKEIFEDLTIYPDNGELYVHVEKSNKNSTDVLITFIGLGGQVKTIYRTTEKAFIVCFRPNVRDNLRKSDIEKCQLVLDFSIHIQSGSVMELSGLSKELSTNEAFLRTVDTVYNQDEEPKIDGLTEQLKEAFRKLDQGNNKENVLSISTAKLWKAILETETEAYPYIEIVGGVVSVEDNDNEIILPYSSDIDALGGFAKTDIVEALQTKGDEEVRLGEVILKQSALNEIRLHKLSFKAKHLEDGDQVFFRTKADKASYIKRKTALQRILDRESVISNLSQYFDTDCNIDATQYKIEVTDTDFSRYDRKDDHGNNIILNEQQRNAFSKLLNNGPLSLLQGPPGTGKTEFIAAFVHYLIEKQKSKSILLVSQSHEAVNTAAERIRKHCIRLGTPLNIVRFSNREGAVSTGLKDVYSNAIIAEKRELFRAEFKYRVEFLSQALGLQPEFISSIVEAELVLFKQIENLSKCFDAIQNQQLEKDEQHQLKLNIASLDAGIRKSLSQVYFLDYPADKDIRMAKREVINHLCSRYSVRPDEAKKATALAAVSRDMIDVLETERVNYEEFFARSRQLVTGTCVGIGQKHLGIAENQYDWVIIDEAARSIASELAIAMQSGKRVLLVGDHKQLPPLYSDAHKRALALKLGIADKDVDLDAILQSDFARGFESPYGIQAGASLLTQYRMAPQIGNIVSATFYNGELENGSRSIPDIYNDVPAALHSIVTWIDTSKLGKKCYHSEDKGISIYNRTEADIIINLLKNISCKPDFVNSLKDIVKKDEAAIGVICMYGEQKRIIRQKFNEIDWNDDFKSLVKIDTVDSYQGKENRIIILSVTRSSPDKKPKFLKTPNRINVAISRAMDRLIIVGSTHMWTGANKDLPLGKVLSFISDRSSEDKQNFYEKSPNYRIVDIEKNLEEVSK